MLHASAHCNLEKLARVKARAKQLTLRKASMTANQLQRRYALLDSSITGDSLPISLASIVRWHTSQESIVRTSLERSEPSTWLKHLERKPGKNTRSPWNVTALVVEEYVRAQFRKRSMQTIPENFAIVSPEGVSSKANLGSSRSPVSSPKLPDPQIVRRLSHNSPSALDLPPEHGVNYPNVRRSESSTRPWKYMSHSDMESQKSSSYSVLNWSRSQTASPNSSRLHIRDFARRRKSDEASSARNSLSEGYSQPEDLIPYKQKQNVYASNPSLQSSNEPDDGDSFPPQSKPGATGTPSNLQNALTPMRGNLNLEDEAPIERPLKVRRESQDNMRSARLHSVRRSLPPSSRLLRREEEKRQRQADEENERQEYEIRAQ
jgi:hypothetical protein